MNGEPEHIPVRVYQSSDRLMVAAPLPGVEPGDIAVRVAGDTLTIHGDVRGVHQEDVDLLVEEWAIGPYHREVRLPHRVDGARANATYGNGVLVLALPKASAVGSGGGDESPAELRLEVTDAPRGAHVGHTGRDLQETSTAEHRQRMSETARQAGQAGQAGAR
jgi:HSP20 family protein